uniref:Uncharacterized protein n=1 Tax=Pediastrum duplex TaxID=3105 RepID=A0A2U8GIN9_PEDDU|nr:hypothetical protein [Pediastrum duplex]
MRDRSKSEEPKKPLLREAKTHDQKAKTPKNQGEGFFHCGYASSHRCALSLRARFDIAETPQCKEAEAFQSCKHLRRRRLFTLALCIGSSVPRLFASVLRLFAPSAEPRNRRTPKEEPKQRSATTEVKRRAKELQHKRN